MNDAVMVRGSGPHLVQRWVLEAEGTRYEAIVVHSVEPAPSDINAVMRAGEAAGFGEYALVCVNTAGGRPSIHGESELRIPRWNVTGGGAWYEFSTAPDDLLVWTYVAEKFRLNDEDAVWVTKLIGQALGRKWAVAR